MDNRDAARVELRLACPNGGAITCGPLTRDASRQTFDFIAGPIRVEDREGQEFTLADRNGIEALALGHFRTDLQLMLSNGHGVVFFGDHDFSQIVELEVVRPAVVQVVSNLASLDRFDMAIGEIELSALRDVVEQIDRIEMSLGALIGYCRGCGSPSSGYFPKPL